MSRTPQVIASALAAAIVSADQQCVPLNLHSAVTDLSEFASAVAEQQPATDQTAAIAALNARIDQLHALLIAAGVEPTPAPAPAPAQAAPQPEQPGNTGS